MTLGDVHRANLRELRTVAHELFDPLWKHSLDPEMRHICYRWLSRQMQVPLRKAHFSTMSIADLHKAIRIIRKANTGIILYWWQNSRS